MTTITNRAEAQEVISGLRDGQYGPSDSSEYSAAMQAVRDFTANFQVEDVTDVTKKSENILAEQPPEEPPEEPSLTDRAKRSFGLAGRSLGQGVAGLAGIGADPLAYLMNLGLDASGAPTEYRFPRLRDTVSEGMTEAGFPLPETKTERITGAAIEGLGAGATVSGVASLPAIASRSPFISKILKGLVAPTPTLAAARPAYQPSTITQTLTSPYEIVGSGAGAGGAAYAAEKGRGLPGQIATGVAAAIAAPATVSTGRQGLNLVKYFLNPNYAKSKVGSEYLRISHHPGQTIKTLESDLEIVPGSGPTTGVASKDPGFLQREHSMRVKGSEFFAETTSQQNAARRAYLESKIDELGDPEAIKAYRDEITTPMREQALEQGQKVNVQPIIDRIEGILKSASGEQRVVKEALPWVAKRLKEIKKKGTIDEADRFYALRKDIDSFLSGKVRDEGKSDWKYAAKELNSVKNALDDAIEEVSPGFKDYLQQYKQLSNRAKQAEKLMEIGDKPVLAAPDPIRQIDIFSQAAFKRIAKQEAAKKGISKVLNDDQMNVITKISADLNRGVAWQSHAAKAGGASQTPRDMVPGWNVAQVIGTALSGLGHGASKVLAGRVLVKSFRWMRGLNDAQVEELMMEAMLDPKLAAMLMRDATKRDAIKTSRALWDKYVDLSIGAIVGAEAGEDPAAIQQGQVLEKQVDALAGSVPSIE